ncbi:hypothetical protein Poli38472_006363 [Pythium oligandrum]|uniref:Uncharacterized protein n=1 Tax=Pythium oligandrum TaxID=41045 RepID=A0A8K1FF13_PYTOL|nr:hypothetical protein Poli38472_006363 [Pythium oligandrum]|eukprot:TMW56353.1 hypothetical protein Poli38472_006363 [Pythium oligandrum]
MAKSKAKASNGAAAPLLQQDAPKKKKSKTKAKAESPTATALVSPASSTGSTASSTTSRPRVASEELIVPNVENVNSVYYGVDSFSPTLVDFYTADQKRIVWSSRAHRKMMTTLHRAWHAKPWKRHSLSFWSGVLASVTYACFLFGATGEIMSQDDAPVHVHALVDFPLLVGSVCFFAAHVVSYFEVINSCHNLEMWLDEYFHGYEPVLHRRYVGFFPTRIDFWTSILGIAGSLLYVVARTFVLMRSDADSNFGVISISRNEVNLIVGYWVPFFLGSFFLLLSAYLAHVEVTHRWFSWRLDRLESWVTGLSMLSAVGIFVSSTLQFIDPLSVLFSFGSCITPFAVGCVIGLGSSFLSIVELESIHKRHKHPEYGLLKGQTSYGTWK